MTTGHQCGQRKTAANMAPALASVLQNAHGRREDPASCRYYLSSPTTHYIYTLASDTLISLNSFALLYNQ